MNSNIINAILDEVIRAITGEVVDRLKDTQHLQAAASDEVKLQLETLGFSNFMAWVNTEAFQAKIKALMPELVQMQLSNEMDDRMRAIVKKVLDDFDVDEEVEKWFNTNSINVDDVDDFHDEVRRVIREEREEEEESIEKVVRKLNSQTETLNNLSARFDAVVSMAEQRLTSLEQSIETLRTDLDRMDKEQAEENRTAAGMLHSVRNGLAKTVDEMNQFIKI